MNSDKTGNTHVSTLPTGIPVYSKHQYCVQNDMCKCFGTNDVYKPTFSWYVEPTFLNDTFFSQISFILKYIIKEIVLLTDPIVPQIIETN